MIMQIFKIFGPICTKNRRSSVVANDTGTAMIEFAITLPVLLTLYLGCVQICDVVAVYRKTTTTARTIVDLTSQQTQVSDSTLQSILDASSQVMAPYSTTRLRMVVTQVTINNAGVAKVDWSVKSTNAPSADTKDTTYTLPAGVAVNDTSLIIGKVNYDYSASIGGVLDTVMPLADTIYMYPRSIKSIPKV
jgi:Flp pilus assembly protein TadG